MSTGRRGERSRAHGEIVDVVSELGDALRLMVRRWGSTAAVDEEPTQAQRDIGATHKYKLIFCWTMEAITNYFYGNNSNQEI